MVDNGAMENNTAQQILDVAQDMVRNRGYSAFSYADISEQVGIRKASVHYHFPSKENLVTMLVKRYRQGMMGECDRIIHSGTDPYEQLRQFVQLYRHGLPQDQICLCAMLAADFAVLPAPIQAEIRAFFADTVAWLTDLLQQGCEAQLWLCQPSAAQEAKSLIALLQGAQLMARSAEDSDEVFDQITAPVLQAKLPPP
ncbi:MAG: TetR/AcrR family transcriptional regulator [Leptolyngbyaceae bacterium]|nr:TetR/AcrR family transcriptional regulator [Leptolyngbyaceae bacterium]